MNERLLFFFTCFEADSSIYSVDLTRLSIFWKACASKLHIELKLTIMLIIMLLITYI